jgi:hypothetical protein
MNVAFDPIVNVVRANDFENAVTWRLGPDSLDRLGDHPGGTAQLPYGEIAELRLSFAPSRFDSARYRCDVRPERGGTLAILSTHSIRRARAAG